MFKKISTKLLRAWRRNRLAIERIKCSVLGTDFIYASESIELCVNSSLGIMLGEHPKFNVPFLKPQYDVIIGWGRKRSGKRAVEVAQKQNCKYLLLEDGFLRSVERTAPTLSIVFDDSGVYYDASSPSKLETLVQQKLTPKEKIRSAELENKWRFNRVSKYNSAREYNGGLPTDYVLLIDQVAGDLSIEFGGANQQSFDKMLVAALEENPSSIIIVKTHPDVITRQKQGHFDIDTLKSNGRIKLIAENCHAVRLIENAKKVYTVTSLMGFEALIWGKPVRCFGMPFYAGWGLTVDDMLPPKRREPSTIEQLVHAALVKYPKYIDQQSRALCEVETVISNIGLQRKLMNQFPEKIYALGFSRWKRPFVRQFLFGSEVVFVKKLVSIPHNSDIAVWGNSMPRGLPENSRVIRIEDGFLRSSGLGADLVRPMSLAVDDVGIYYDATCASKLEQLLSHIEFTPEMLARGKKLKQQIIVSGITKYNLNGEKWKRPPESKHVILVSGQVEKDASILYGAPEINTNIGLLKATRLASPDAYIVYKPHPDVVAGLRTAGENEKEAYIYCNEIVTNGDAVSMLAQVDEVHVITSLIGFEALLRGVKVTCYGIPFYAGWGLTTDILPIPRRYRLLQIEELVFVTLVEYTRYVSRTSHQFINAEEAIEELVSWKISGPTKMPIWRRYVRFCLRLWMLLSLRSN